MASQVALPQRQRNAHIRAPSPQLSNPIDLLATVVNGLGVISSQTRQDSTVEKKPKEQQQDASKGCLFTGKTMSFLRHLQRCGAKGQRTLVFIRGCPGSGKSTLARHLKLGGEIVSADYYFQVGSRYYYDRNLCSEAHEWCFEKARQFMELGVNPLIVDNTNLTAREMTPLTLLGLCHEYKIVTVEPDTPWRYNPHVLYRQNVHNVPYHKILRMLEKFDRGLTVKSLLATAIRSVWDPNEGCPRLAGFPGSHFHPISRSGLRQSSLPSSHNCYSRRFPRPLEEFRTRETEDDRDYVVLPPSGKRNSTSDLDGPWTKETDNGTEEVEDENDTAPGQSCNTGATHEQVTASGSKEGLLDPGGTCSTHQASDKAVVNESIANERTSDDVGDDDDAKLAKMESRFSEVPQHLLRHLLEMCRGDVDYAIAILSESGYHSVELFAEPCNEVEKDEPNKVNKDSEHPDKENLENQLILPIPSSFLLKLETLFGKVKLNVEEKEALLQFPLEIDEAKLVHCLLRTINRRLRADSANGTTSSSTEDDELFFPIKVLTYENEDGDPTYAAVSLKGDLYNNFAMLDEGLIDSVFRHCRYNAKEAAQCLKKLLAAHHPADKDLALCKKERQRTNGASCQQDIPDRAREERLYREHLRKAARAYQKKMFGVGQFYAEEARKHLQARNQAEAIDEEAQHLIYLEVMDETDRLDLHGLTVASALRLLSKALKKRSADTKKYGSKLKKKVVVLTGWGKHSDSQVGRIRQAVEQYLFNRSYMYQQTETGIFRVTVP